MKANGVETEMDVLENEIVRASLSEIASKMASGIGNAAKEKEGETQTKELARREREQTAIASSFLS